ncbi:hypothetical protein Nmel_014098 [Mimus melanotis]
MLVHGWLESYEVMLLSKLFHACTQELLAGVIGLMCQVCLHISVAELNKSFYCFIFLASLIHHCSPNEEHVKNLELFSTENSVRLRESRICT